MRTVTISSDKKKFNVRLKAELDFKTLGSRLKGDMKKVTGEFSSMSDEKLSEFQKAGTITVAGHVFTTDEVRLKYAFGDDKAKGKGGEKGHFDAHSDGEVGISV